MAGYEKGNNTKRRLIMAMYRNLEKKDASEITVRELAKENGCSPAALYRHFDSLEYLIILGTIRFFSDYMEEYGQLMDAYDQGDKEVIQGLQKQLEQRIKAEARDIRDKYIEPPYTTEFGILFLPVEGLYAEVVRLGLVETLQRDYKINIAGPTTMAALLNSLQMGFRTLAIQKRSGEVWNVLGAVKSEFQKFGDVLKKTRDRLRQADDELEALVGTRTNQINRRLREVSSLSEDNAQALLGE